MRVLLKAEDYEKVLPRLAAEVIEKENMDKLSIVGIRRRGKNKHRYTYRCY